MAHVIKKCPHLLYYVLEFLFTFIVGLIEPTGPYIMPIERAGADRGGSNNLARMLSPVTGHDYIIVGFSTR